MSRNRVIYQSEALFASKNIDSTGRADHMQLRRVQSANYSFNVTRTDLNQFGQLSRIQMSKRLVIQKFGCQEFSSLKMKYKLCKRSVG